MGTLFPLDMMRRSELERAAYMAGQLLLAEVVDHADADEARIEELEDLEKDNLKTIADLRDEIKALTEQQDSMRREVDDTIKSCRKLLTNLESRITAINNLPA